MYLCMLTPTGMIPSLFALIMTCVYRCLSTLPHVRVVATQRYSHQWHHASTEAIRRKDTLSALFRRPLCIDRLGEQRRRRQRKQHVACQEVPPEIACPARARMIGGVLVLTSSMLLLYLLLCLGCASDQARAALSPPRQAPPALARAPARRAFGSCGVRSLGGGSSRGIRRHRKFRHVALLAREGRSPSFPRGSALGRQSEPSLPLRFPPFLTAAPHLRARWFRRRSCRR